MLFRSTSDTGTHFPPADANFTKKPTLWIPGSNIWASIVLALQDSCFKPSNKTSRYDTKKNGTVFSVHCQQIVTNHSQCKIRLSCELSRRAQWKIETLALWTLLVSQPRCWSTKEKSTNFSNII